jgi:hypothetical protein
MARVDRLAIVLLALAACPSPSAPTTPPPPPVEMAHAVLPDVPFDQLDIEQRAEFMKQRVIPTMAPLFASHVQLTCETCHGKRVAGHYAMPNRTLPKLGADLSKFKREDVEWMARDIKPTMAKLLGRAEFSATVPNGFGCSVCHTLEAE